MIGPITIPIKYRSWKLRVVLITLYNYLRKRVEASMMCSLSSTKHFVHVLLQDRTTEVTKAYFHTIKHESNFVDESIKRNRDILQLASNS